MKKLTFVMLAALALAGCFSLEEHQAGSRVEMMLSGWTEGRPGQYTDLQAAVSMWFEGSRVIPDRDLLGQASLDFDAWRGPRGLRTPIHEWSLTSISREGESEPPVWLAEVEIDGQAHRLRFRDMEPMEWAD